MREHQSYEKVEKILQYLLSLFTVNENISHFSVDKNSVYEIPCIPLSVRSLQKIMVLQDPSHQIKPKIRGQLLSPLSPSLDLDRVVVVVYLRRAGYYHRV